MLLQAYSADRDAKIVVLPMPLRQSAEVPPKSYATDRPSLLTSPSFHLSCDEKTLHLHPAVQRLTQVLHLDSTIGFIRMMYDDAIHDWVRAPTQCRNRPDLSQVPLDVKFGMPLYDPAVTARVCQLIERYARAPHYCALSRRSSARVCSRLLASRVTARRAAS